MSKREFAAAYAPTNATSCVAAHNAKSSNAAAAATAAAAAYAFPSL